MHAPNLSLIPVELLLRAYRGGVFPMADHRDDPEVYWVEPRERAIIPLGGFRMSKSLRKTLRQDRFRVTCDHAFAAVIAQCALPREEHAESWISHRVEASYNALHRAGHAHSIECWQDGELVGGLYGVAFDRVFCGESMFSRTSDASKVALAWLVALLKRAGFVLLDCQFMTGHLASMGAVEISRDQYQQMLARACDKAPFSSLPQDHAALLQASSASGEAASSSPGKLIAQSFTQTS